MWRRSSVSFIAGLAAILFPLQGIAQADIVLGRIDPPRTPLHDAAMRAGHQALYLCSGHFLTGLDEEVMRRDAMLDSTANESWDTELEATVDTENRLVQVRYADGLPPRVAAWRPHVGCAQLPIGATPDAVPHLPRLPDAMETPALDAEAWPVGDAHALIDEHVAPALAGVVEAAFDSDIYGGVTWGIIVANKHGILTESYGRGYDMHSLQRTHSAAKSLAATLVGVAVEQGLVSTDDQAGFPEWMAPGDPRAVIAMDDFLRMSSGLYTEGGRNPQQEVYLAGKSIDDSSLRLSVNSPPGTRYVYAGTDTNLAVRMLRERMTDEDYLRFPFEQLLWKLGMTRTHPETDWQGNYLMSGQMYASARDLLRLGLLYLNNGVWQGERLLPEDWVEYVSTPRGAQPRGSWADSNCVDCSGRAYGAQFFLPAKGFDLPDDAFMMSGGRGQYVLIIPSLEILVVRRGVDISRRALRNPADVHLTRFEMERFAADVIAAMGE